MYRVTIRRSPNDETIIQAQTIDEYIDLLKNRILVRENAAAYERKRLGLIAGGGLVFWLSNLSYSWIGLIASVILTIICWLVLECHRVVNRGRSGIINLFHVRYESKILSCELNRYLAPDARISPRPLEYHLLLVGHLGQ